MVDAAGMTTTTDTVRSSALRRLLVLLWLTGVVGVVAGLLPMAGGPAAAATPTGSAVTDSGTPAAAPAAAPTPVDWPETATVAETAPTAGRVPHYSWGSPPRNCTYYEQRGTAQPTDDGRLVDPRFGWPRHPEVGQYYWGAPCLFGDMFHPDQAHEWEMTATPNVVREGETFTVRGHGSYVEPWAAVDPDVRREYTLGEFWKRSIAGSWALNPDCCIVDAPPLRVPSGQAAPAPIVEPRLVPVDGCGRMDDHCTWRVDRAPVFPRGTTELPWFAVGVTFGRPEHQAAVGWEQLWEAPVVLIPDPTPAAGFSYTAVDGEPRTIQFRNGSWDRDFGTIVAGRYDFGDGQSATVPHPRHTYVRPGDYTVTLTVTDDDGYTGTTSKVITVDEQPPVARIDWDAETSPSPVLHLDGSESSDPDPGDRVEEWRWVVRGEDCNGSCFETAATGERVDVPLPAEGRYDIELTVTDTTGLTASTTRAIRVAPPSLRVTVVVDPPVVRAPEPTATDPEPDPVPVTVRVTVENTGRHRVDHIHFPSRLTILTRDGLPGATDGRIGQVGGPDPCACEIDLDPGWSTTFTYRLAVADDGWWRIRALVSASDPDEVDPERARTIIANGEATLDATGQILTLTAELAPGVRSVIAGTTFYVVGELANRSTNQRVELPADFFRGERTGALAAGRRPALLQKDADLTNGCAACGRRLPRTLEPGQKVRFAIGYTTVNQPPFLAQVTFTYRAKGIAVAPDGRTTEVETPPVAVKAPISFPPAPPFQAARFASRFKEAAMIQMGNRLVEARDFLVGGKFKHVPYQAVMAMTEAWRHMSVAERWRFLVLPSSYLGEKVTQALYDAVDREVATLYTLAATGRFDELADRMGTLYGDLNYQEAEVALTEALTAGFGYLFAAGGRLALAEVRRSVPDLVVRLESYSVRTASASGLGLDLTKVPNGVVVKLAQGERYWGVSRAKLTALIEYARKHRLSIVLRDRSAKAIEWLEKRGAIPKMEDIKVKSVTELDTYLGYADDDVCTIVFRSPTDPALDPRFAGLDPVVQQQVRRHYDFRLAEYAKHRELFFGTGPYSFATKGIRFRQGGRVRQGTVRVDDQGRVWVREVDPTTRRPVGPERRVATDVDVFHIRRADGTEFTAAEYPEVMAHFRYLEDLLDLQHFVTANWYATDPVHQATRRATFEAHGLNGGKALLEVSGDGLRTARVDLNMVDLATPGPMRQVMYVGTSVPVIGEPIR